MSHESVGSRVVSWNYHRAGAHGEQMLWSRQIPAGYDMYRPVYQSDEFGYRDASIRGRLLDDVLPGG